MTNKKIFLMGAHVSTAGGFDQAIARGDALGCTAIQIFTKSNRQWRAKYLAQEEIDRFNVARQHATHVRSITAHASYLINLGSTTDTIRHQSIAALADEIIRCDQLNIPYLVMHPGSGARTNTQETINLIAQGIDAAFEQSDTSSVQLLLETMAGQGNTIGHTFEQLAAIYAATSHKKGLSFCADTCHLFTAGYDIRNPATYDELWKKFDTLLGLENLKSIHLNDSKKLLGSRVDRHEHIGKGQIGLDAFARLLNDERLAFIPKLLETPPEQHQENMATLISLLSARNYHLFRQSL